MLAAACSSVPAPTAADGVAAHQPPARAQALPPPAPREFRAAWVASVANIDWPSRRGLPSEEQKREALEIIDKAQALGLNALLLQVRPAADALYASALEPWSEFLSGEQGRPPEPYYDPLQFWIEEAHRRGIELHAWFNPYRARHTMSGSKHAPHHIANTHPGVVKSYGGLLWMDPGEPFAAQRTLEVILDVVRRYDIDGVHIDDYFYPYPVTAPGSMPPVEVEFPDEGSWQAWLAQGGGTDKAAWRRANVNRLVEALYTGIKKEKPWVRFGISPFGIGRPDRRPRGISGFSQYDKLHADVERWLANGWLDYLAPQLYWPIAQKEQAFEVLLDYWHGENPLGRHIFPGLYTSRIDASEKSWVPTEIIDQIALTRARRFPQGHIHFSAVALKENRRGISERLKQERYADAAVPPAATWLAAAPVRPPALSVVPADAPGAPAMVNLTCHAPLPWRLGVWLRRNGSWRFVTSAGAMEAGGARSVQYGFAVAGGPGEGELEAVVASAFDRFGNESERVVLDLTRSGRQ
jgi:uncharacterized lipoprotein YddW (UPF0748 family)